MGVKLLVCWIDSRAWGSPMLSRAGRISPWMYKAGVRRLWKGLGCFSRRDHSYKAEQLSIQDQK